MKGKFLRWIYAKKLYNDDNVNVVFYVFGERDGEVIYSSLEELTVGQKIELMDSDDPEVWEDVTPKIGDEYEFVYGTNIWRINSIDLDTLRIEFNDFGWLPLEEFFKYYERIEVDAGYTEGYKLGYTGLKWL